MKLQRTALVAAIAFTFVTALSAQTQSAPAHPAMNKMQIAFHTEMMDVAPVKGSPFCATIVNEHTQVFADGNRIHTTDNSNLCRDSEGRTRRESQLNLLGAVPQGAAPKLITITDPVAGVRYTLDTQSKTARKMPLQSGGLPSLKALKGGAGTQDVLYLSTGKGAAELPPPPPGAAIMIEKHVIEHGPNSSEAPPNSENLGDQVINGIHAAGTRVSTVIPAGQMGNDQPITVVSEDWYSPDLKATVMTKHTDPWAGTVTTQFTNVTASEPDASLFTVPSDYKVVDDKDGPMTIRIQPPVTP
jgi:hypothetical protein